MGLTLIWRELSHDLSESRKAVIHRSERCEIRAGFAGREFLLDGTDIDLERAQSQFV